ncbi:peroxisomal membrane protein PEX16 [Thecamonas trahens ATCC 50062]|uniref:Peroxisomal membrane protein PEX16 n=1 Tax=Thecamonas trahens ATCC 50062 TaxID=461836 RepID=A0A0L0DS27_THETB|nr:peroxisomal membrane protein PEX16 [Thecamonas trahens ATCC 50062]KNC55119.1 peroxisomal membrane protein PEX16 [Thecamonas trahens ATCC 50062]|eukprot:XP_013753300.1 peroxisomal membrane protein PEX16 [Thecamonas trahens ATCC 50062]
MALNEAVDAYFPGYTQRVLELAPTLGGLESYLRSAVFCLPGRFSSSELLLQSLTTVLDVTALLHDALITSLAHTTLPLPTGISTSTASFSSLSSSSSSSSSSSAAMIGAVVEFVKSAAPAPLPLPSIALLLSAVRTIQVWVEVLATRKFGQRARWLVVLLVEVAKALLKFWALIKSQAALLPLAIPRIIRDPALRSAAAKVEEAEAADSARVRVRQVFKDSPAASADSPATFSALVGDVARVSPAALLKRRKQAWSSASSPLRRGAESGSPRPTPLAPAPRTPLTPHLLAGEVLHAVAPVAYVGAILAAGHSSWKPWTLSLVLELASIGLSSTCGGGQRS